MRTPIMLATVGILTGCAGAPRTSPRTTGLTSIDTVWYAVPGRTRSEWMANLPRAAQAAGIPGGAASFTLAHMMWSGGRTRTTSIGCQLDGSDLQLRLGHVMPTLTPDASPPDDERAAWNAFTATLWEGAHTREAIGARLADSLRHELRNSRAIDCAQLISLTREKLAAFPARFSSQVAAEQTGRPATIR